MANRRMNSGSAPEGFGSGNGAVSATPRGGTRTSNALRGYPLVALLGGGFVATYTFSSVNVALEQIQSELGASTAQLPLVIAAYAITFAVFLILGGRLGDKVGRDRMYAWGLLAFAIATVAAGLAPSMTWLLVLRVVQGITAAMLVPQILSIIQTTSYGPARLRAVALFCATSGLGNAAGQVIAGVLIDLDIGGRGWRSVLWFVALMALILAPGAFRLPRAEHNRRARMDGAGAALLGLLMLLLLAPISLGPSRHWPAWLIAMLICAPAVAALFWQYQGSRESRGKAALVPPTVVRFPALRVGLAMNFIFFAGFGAFMYEFAITTQRELGYTALESGLTLGGFSVVFAVVSMSLGVFRRLFGSYLIVVGAAGQILSLVAIAAIFQFDWPHSSQWLLQPALALMGAAQALMFAPLVNEVMAAIPQAVAGLTGGLFVTAQQSSLALGVAAYGSFFAALTTTFESGLVGAFMICLLIQAVTSVVFIALGLRLRRIAAG